MVEVGPITTRVDHAGGLVVDGLIGVDTSCHEQVVAYVAHAVEEVVHGTVGLYALARGYEGIVLQTVGYEALLGGTHPKCISR